MSTNIPQSVSWEERGTLTHLYLELGLPLRAALQAAKADLWQLEVPGDVAENLRVTLPSSASRHWVFRTIYGHRRLRYGCARLPATQTRGGTLGWFARAPD